MRQPENLLLTYFVIYNLVQLKKKYLIFADFFVQTLIHLKMASFGSVYRFILMSASGSQGTHSSLIRQSRQQVSHHFHPSAFIH